MVTELRPIDSPDTNAPTPPAAHDVHRAALDGFRARVQAELTARGISRRQASIAAHLSPSTVSMMLNDVESVPGPRTVLGLAELFGWSPTETLRWAQLPNGGDEPEHWHLDPLTDYQRAVEQLPIGTNGKQLLLQMALQLLPSPAPPAPRDVALEELVDALLDAQPYHRWAPETRQFVYQEAAELRQAEPTTWATTLARVIHHAATVRRAGPQGVLKSRQYEYAFKRTLRGSLHGNPNLPA